MKSDSVDNWMSDTQYQKSKNAVIQNIPHRFKLDKITHTNSTVQEKIYGKGEFLALQKFWIVNLILKSKDSEQSIYLHPFCGVLLLEAAEFATFT